MTVDDVIRVIRQHLDGPELIAELDRQLVAMHTLNQKQAETIARKDRIIATLQREVARLKAETTP